MVGGPRRGSVECVGIFFRYGGGSVVVVGE